MSDNSLGQVFSLKAAWQFLKSMQASPRGGSSAGSIPCGAGVLRPVDVLYVPWRDLGRPSPEPGQRRHQSWHVLPV
eukprot:2143796-Lingulodinium_polyedra.AAC.1